MNLVEHPLEGEALRAFRIFAGIDTSDDCWTESGTSFAQLFCYFDLNRALYIPEYDEADYVARMVAFNTTETNLGEQVGLLGFADDDWLSGTPTYMSEFDTAEYLELERKVIDLSG